MDSTDSMNVDSQMNNNNSNSTDNDKDQEKKVEHECDNCLKKGFGFPRCSKCKKVWYCSRECQKEDWQDHKKVCIAEPIETPKPKEEKEEEDQMKIPDPIWKIKIAITNSSTTTNFETLLSLHPLFTFITRERLRTIVPKGEALKMELTPSDIVTAELSNLKDESAKVMWENLKAEEFVQITECAKCEEGLRFGMSNTRYDNWNHKELFFFGLDLPKEKYPGNFEKELSYFENHKGN